MKTQNQQIEAYLKSGKKITPLTALRNFGSLRLGARIFQLRKQGLDIKTNLITRRGKTFAEYTL